MKKKIRRVVNIILSYVALFSFIIFVVSVLFDSYNIAAYSIIVCTISCVCRILLADDDNGLIPPFGYFGFWP